MEKINNIIVHCSDSTWGSAAEIRRWHLERGWRDIGYHFTIMNGHVRPDLYIDSLNGSVEAGRFLDGDNFVSLREIGAHTLGYNGESIGICLIGKTTFSVRQIGSLIQTLNILKARFSVDPNAILGHCETESAGGKTCPNIDMKNIRYLINLTEGK